MRTIDLSKMHRSDYSEPLQCRPPKLAQALSALSHSRSGSGKPVLRRDRAFHEPEAAYRIAAVPFVLCAPLDYLHAVPQGVDRRAPRARTARTRSSTQHHNPFVACPSPSIACSEPAQSPAPPAPPPPSISSRSSLNAHFSELTPSSPRSRRIGEVTAKKQAPEPYPSARIATAFNAGNLTSVPEQAAWTSSHPYSRSP